MEHIQENITLWSNYEDVCEMKIFSNVTRIHRKINFHTTTFGLVYNTEPQCTWTVRFISTNPTLPPKFFEKFSFEILLTRRFLQDYGIMDMGKFYNNLDFDGAQIEEENAQEFANKCSQTGIFFLQDDSILAPQIFDKDVKSPQVFRGTEKAGNFPQEWANLVLFQIANEKAFVEDKMTQTEGFNVMTVEKELGTSL